MRPAACHLMTLMAVIASAGSRARGELTAPSRDEVAKWLAHGESLVETAKCEYTCVVPPTSDEMVSVIELFWKRRGKPGEAARYITRGEQYTERFWRSGVK